MFCQYCGKKIDDDSKFCIYCGKNTNEDDILTYDFTNGQKGTNNKETHLFWWSLLYFLFFPIGIIAFFKYKGKKPKRSKLGLIMAWFSIITIGISGIVAFILLSF